MKRIVIAVLVVLAIVGGSWAYGEYSYSAFRNKAESIEILRRLDTSGCFELVVTESAIKKYADETRGINERRFQAELLNLLMVKKAEKNCKNIFK